MEELISEFFKINYTLYQQAKNPFKTHGPDHHLRVLKNALVLASKLKLDLNWDVLVPAVLLHDITAYEPDKTANHWNHHEDVDEAKRQLKKINYSEEKTKKILALIAVHGSDQKNIKENEPPEATILRDADKMDELDVLGITRIIMTLARRGYSPKEIAQKCYKDKYLEQKYKSIKTKYARDFVKNDYEDSLDFFKNLYKKLN